MNIWIFNHYAITPDLPGGTRHYDLGKELVKRGHNVVIIATSFHHYVHRETRLKPGEQWKIEDVDGVKFVWVRTPWYQQNDWQRVWNMVVFALRSWWFGRKLPKAVPGLGKPDVVIGSSPHLFTPLAAYLVARHFRVPFIMEVRDLWPQTLIDMEGLSGRHPLVKVLQHLEKFLYRRAEQIITLLPLAHEYMVACGVPRAKIAWIPNGVDLSRFENFTPSANDGGFKVLYLGAHGRANALDVLIETAKILQDQGYQGITILLVGDGPEKPRLISMAKDFGLRNVEFRNPVPKREVLKVLGEADALLFNLEGVAVFQYGISPNKLFDFMATGKPVISSVKAAFNPVDEARCGFTVPPRDPQALAEAIVKVYRMSREEREAMGKRGRKYVEEHHDIRKLATRLEQVLHQVIESSSV